MENIKIKDSRGPGVKDSSEKTGHRTQGIAK